MKYKIHQNKEVCNEEWREVEGDPVGDTLAVRHDMKENVFVVDHLPTGRRLPGHWPTQACALTVARSVVDKAEWGGCVDDNAESNRAKVPPEVITYMRDVSGSPRAWLFGEDPPKPPSVRIDFELSLSLSVDDLWPDGDWPDEITVGAVRELIDDSGGPGWVLDGWNLADSLSVSVHKLKMAKVTP